MPNYLHDYPIKGHANSFPSIAIFCPQTKNALALCNVVAHLPPFLLLSSVTTVLEGRPVFESLQGHNLSCLNDV